MKMVDFLIRIASAVGALALVMAAYVFVARPWAMNRGSTAAERARAMPGDELDPNPTFLANRAITIDATPEQIWPWLIQIGYTRAGFYGYDMLENVGSPRGIRSATTILPEFQNFKVGDPIPISPAGGEFFYAVVKPQYIIWSSMEGPRPGGFTWELYPIDATHTRLVSRIRWTHHSLAKPGQFALDVLTEFADSLAVPKVLQGVKGRVEGHHEPYWLTDAEFWTYVLAWLVFVAGFVLTLARPLTMGRWLAGLAAGAAWLLVWYVPLPFWGGLLLEAAVVWGLLAAHSHS